MLSFRLYFYNFEAYLIDESHVSRGMGPSTHVNTLTHISCRHEATAHQIESVSIVGVRNS